jgi:general nucleoside transport system permease protein
MSTVVEAAPSEVAPAVPKFENRWVGLARMVALFVVSIAVALGITAGLVAAIGDSPTGTLNAILQGTVDNAGALGQTIDVAIPTLVIALGTLIAVRAGMFNIGQAGQLNIGALTGAAIAIKVGGPGPLVLVLSLAGAAVGGALWAGIAALLWLWRRIAVVIATLLLSFVASQVVVYFVSDPNLLQQPNPFGSGGAGSIAQTAPIPAGTRLGFIGSYPNFSINVDVFIAIALFVVTSFLLARSRWGFQLRMVGANALAARRFGVRAGLVAAGALVLSGAFAGLAGGLMLTGGAYQVQGGFDNNYGTDGLLCALVAYDRPALLLPASFFFGMIRSGGTFLLATGVPSYLAAVLEGLLVLAVVFPPVYRDRREWARRLRAARAAAKQAPPAAESGIYHVLPGAQ